MSEHTDFYVGFFTELHKAETVRIDSQQPEGEAICFECGATVPLDAVYSGYEQGNNAPCGHVWQSYRYDRQYILV